MNATSLHNPELSARLKPGRECVSNERTNRCVLLSGRDSDGFVVVSCRDGQVEDHRVMI